MALGWEDHLFCLRTGVILLDLDWLSGQCISSIQLNKHRYIPLSRSVDRCLGAMNVVGTSNKQDLGCDG